MFQSLFQNKRRKLSQEWIISKDRASGDSGYNKFWKTVIKIKTQKIQVHGLDIFWNKIMMIKTKKIYCMLHNHCYWLKIDVDAFLSCKQVYKNRQLLAPSIKLEAKLNSESQSNGMLYTTALKRHSTLIENNLRGSSSQRTKARKIMLA